MKPTANKADEALSHLRVSNATLLCCKVVLEDAMEFIDRGIATMDECQADLLDALSQAGIRITPMNSKFISAKGRKKKAPARKKAGAKSRR